MPDQHQDIFERIRNAYRDLTASERKLADFVLDESNVNTQFMSITQLAEECSVAEATVSRFCRTLGLKGFNAFKLELAKYVASRPASSDACSPETAEGRRSEVHRLSDEAIRQTMELLSPESVEKAVELFERARRVLCIGNGGSMIMAYVCSNLFATVTNKFVAISETHTQLATAATMGPEDVIVLFSYSGATTNGIQVLELAKSRGVRTVLVTRYVKSPAANLADVVLCCGSNETPFQSGSVPAKIAQLVVMDVLYQEYCFRNREACDRQIEDLAAALACTHL